MVKKPTYEELEKRVKESEREALKLKQERDELQRQLYLSNTILSAMPDQLVLKSHDFIYQAVNPAFCDFVGKPEEEIIGNTDFDIFPRSKAETYRQDDKVVMETGKPQIQDEETSGKEGKKWLQGAKIPVIDETGTIVGILCSFRDVSERKQAEVELRLS